MGRKYWKKKSYLFQGFVTESKLQEDGKIPENPIRRFIIGSQIFNIVKNALMDSEIEELPTDYVRGLDFKITKTSKGGYADYSTSNWARKESALTQAEQDAIEAHGLFNLTEFLPKKPNEAELRIIKEMFDASVDGQPYDNDRWGSYYRPYGLEAPVGKGSQAVATEAKVDHKPVEAIEDDESVASAEPISIPKAPAGDKAQDILALIRARQNKPA
jgi:hypothetical protein